MMNEPEVTVKKGFTLIRATGAYKPPVGKRWANPETAKRLREIWAAKEEVKKKKGVQLCLLFCQTIHPLQRAPPLNPQLLAKGNQIKKERCWSFQKKQL